MSSKEIIAELIKGRPAPTQALSQPLWCTVEQPPHGESITFSFSNLSSESSNVQLQGALPHPQQFVLDGFELRVYGSLLAREIATLHPRSYFEFCVGNKIYSELPIGSVLWSGSPEFPGFRLERTLLLDPLTKFSGRIFWRPPFAVSRERFKLSFTLFLLGTLLRPAA